VEQLEHPFPPAEDEKLPPQEKPKEENSFSVSWLPHESHFGGGPWERTSSSNLLPHLRHSYSNIGIGPGAFIMYYDTTEYEFCQHHFSSH